MKNFSICFILILGCDTNVLESPTQPGSASQHQLLQATVHCLQSSLCSISPSFHQEAPEPGRCG